MATATRKRTSFGVTCPYCHDGDAVLSIDLNDFEQVTCGGCDETFSARQARDLVAAELAKWDAVVRLVEMAGACLAE